MAMYFNDVRHNGRSPYSTIDNQGLKKWLFYSTKDEGTNRRVIHAQGALNLEYITSLQYIQMEL